MFRIDRRKFLETSTAASLVATTSFLRGGESPTPIPALGWHAPRPFEKIVIEGSPRERGRLYGRRFAPDIRRFLEDEIVLPFAREGQSKPEMLRYAAGCAAAVRDFSSEVQEEMQGMSEGSGLSVEELIIITLHEELYHKGVLPKADHCTAVAVSPTVSGDGHTYCGQTWDWFYSLYNAAQLLEWRRADGPSVLAFAYPGLWIGAGINSEGLALCWTSAQGLGISGPRVGVPTYVLIAQILYQRTLDDAIAVARRSGHAGWFTFVVADRHGNLANIEGSPKQLAVETYEEYVARNYYGTRAMAGVDEQGCPKYSGRTPRAYELLGQSRGQMSLTGMQRFFAADGICDGGSHPQGREIRTLDALVFDCSAPSVYLTRGPAGAYPWTRFAFTS